MHPDEMVTIQVPADSLEAAIAGVRRGETWEYEGWELYVESDGGMTMQMGRDCISPPSTHPGWHRVTEAAARDTFRKMAGGGK